MDLGDRIRTAREAAGLSQAQLAERIGTTQRTIGNWERGTATPRSKTGALETVLGIQLRRPADTHHSAPRIDEATDGQIIADLARRLAERNDRIRELTAQLEHAHHAPPMPDRWAARPRPLPDGGDTT